MAKIGIGITTRNRPEILDLSLKHHLKFPPKNDSFRVIVDDGEMEPKNVPFGHEYINPDKRVGVARAKNKCLTHIIDADCDYIFLFDDDCFPIKEGWDELFINASQKTGLQHMMYLKETGIISKKKSDGLIDEYNHCAGCMLFFTKEIIQTAGGFDPRFGLYGYEHAHFTRRLFTYNQTKYGHFCSPVGSDDYFYSIDFEPSENNPPLGEVQNFQSSVTEEEKNDHLKRNSDYYTGEDYDMKVYISPKY